MRTYLDKAPARVVVSTWMMGSYLKLTSDEDKVNLGKIIPSHQDGEARSHTLPWSTLGPDCLDMYNFL